MEIETRILMLAERQEESTAKTLELIESLVSRVKDIEEYIVKMVNIQDKVEEYQDREIMLLMERIEALENKDE